MKRNVELEKFYTKKEIAKKCLDKLNLKSYDLIIEPSAGNGSFSNLIDNCLALDLVPENSKIKKQDYFDFDMESGNILVVGNPPFGRQSSLAIRFINHSCFAKTIAFILPLSFKKESMLNKLNPYLHLTYEKDLPVNSFKYNGIDFNIPCGFFIYEKKDIKRVKKEKIIPIGYSFCNKEIANASLRRVGFYAGKCSDNLNVSSSSHYFLKLDDLSFINDINNYKWEHNNTVGARSISKEEFKEVFNKLWKDKQKDLNLNQKL